MSSLNPNCTNGLFFAQSIIWNSASVAQIVLSLAGLILIYINAKICYKRKAGLHTNFVILAVSTFAFYILHNVTILYQHISKQFQYRTFSNPCDLHTTLGDCAILKGFTYTGVLGFSLAHFSLCAERTLATFYVKRYEKFGIKFGVVLAILIWTVALSTNAYIFGRVADGEGIIDYCTGSSPNSVEKLKIMHYIMLAIDTMTVITDIILLKINRQKQKTKIVNYNLSKSYQISENAATIRMMIPFATTHSLIFSFYLIATIVCSYVFTVFEDPIRKIVYECVFTINTLYVCLSMAIIRYLQIKGGGNTKVTIIKMSKQAETFYQQFDAQLNQVPIKDKRCTTARN